MTNPNDWDSTVFEDGGGEVLRSVEWTKDNAYITIIIKDGYWETTKKGKFWRKPGYIGFRSANAHHRVDLKEGTKPMTIFIPGPFGLRKGPRSEYGIDFKTKKN